MRHQRRNGHLGLCVGIAALSVLAVFPAGALAGTASTRIKRVFYTATPGEVNNLTLGLSGADYRLDDLGATITAAPPCAAGGTTATCPAAGIIGITVSADDGADSVTNTTATPSTLSGGDGDDSLAGGSGNDTLRGNKGIDTHSGGAGDDYIDARGDAADVVNCGDGADTVIGDTADSIAADCEAVDRGVAPPETPAPTPTASPPPAATDLLGPSEARLLAPGACVTEKLGTVQNDLVDGTDLGDSLFGLQGDDILNGLPGDDCLFGGVGSDRLSGSQGDDTSTVRLPRRLHEVSVRLPEARQEMTARLGRAPSPSELAEALGVTADDLARLEKRSNGMVDNRASDTAARELDASEARLLLADAFRTLDETERTIIYLRFVRERSRREAAEELKMSQSALARRTTTALTKLRGELEDRAFERGSSPPAVVADAAAEPAPRPDPSLSPTQRRETRADEPAHVSGAKARAGHSGRLMLRMPQSLHAELAEAAQREEVSLNQFITNTLAASQHWHSDGRETQTQPQWMRAAIVTNIVVVVIAGAIALGLLIIAWQQGW